MSAETHQGGDRARHRAARAPSPTPSPSSRACAPGSPPSSTTLGLAAAVAGTHPLGRLAGHAGLARRPLPAHPADDGASSPGASRPSPCTSTSAVDEPERAIGVVNRLRAHLPLLLALSANSPFWQGRDARLASARTPVFGAFPRDGHPAPVRLLRGLARDGRRADPLRRVPRADVPVVGRPPAAAVRDGRGADHGRADDGRRTPRRSPRSCRRWRAGRSTRAPRRTARPRPARCSRRTASWPRATAWRPSSWTPSAATARPVAEQVDELLAVLRPHAEALGCGAELAGVAGLMERTGAGAQRDFARDGIDTVVPALAARFSP